MTNELVEIVGNKGRLHLHEGQEKAWNSKRRFVFVIAGTQSGKTTFGPWWLYREIKRCGPGDYLAVTATYDLFKLKMLPEMLRVFGGYLDGWYYHATDRVIRATDSETRIILRSAHTPGGLESATAKAAWLDECGQDDFRLDSWEAVQRRLSMYQGRVLGTTTPYNLGWLKTQVFDLWRGGNSDFEVIQFKSTMNPNFPQEEYNRVKETMADWKFRMFYDGDFTRPAGMIYGDFDDSNVVDPFPIPKEWPRFVGVDFGANNTATMWLAHDAEKDVYYLYRETLAGGMTTKEHANEALRHAKHENVIAWAGGSKSETQQRMDWAMQGVVLGEPYIVDVEAGIDRVIALVKPKRLYVFNTCKGIIDEFGTYARKLDNDGQPTDKIKDKETFHRLDALRYIVQRFGVPSGAALIDFA